MNRGTGFLVGGVLCVVAQLAGATGDATGVTRPRPLFDAMTAMRAAMGSLGPAFSGDAMIGAVDFDPARETWHFTVDRATAKQLPHAEVTLDERSGKVCVRDRDAIGAGCALQGSVAPQLDALRKQRLALAQAVAHPPPDLQGVMDVLIRYQASNPKGYLHQNRMPLYVGMYWPDGRPPLDLSEAEIHKLGHLVGASLHPASSKPKTDPRSAPAVMLMSVGLPLRRGDGDYDVQYGYYCGDLCASWWSAVLHHDASGWHLVSTQMNAIS